jgi:hypothetical protein
VADFKSIPGGKTVTVYCARHGLTEKVWKNLCGEKRHKLDAARQDPKSATFSAEYAALRTALEVPDDVCGRAGLPVCASCSHPAHEGRKCSSIASQDPVTAASVWCKCEVAAAPSPVAPVA